jgi:hypothetical protein
MTRACPEPLYASPLADRLGYLANVVAALDISSPDSLHGAAHYLPLTGLELPMLGMLADLNDAAIDAGMAADLDELSRVRALTRRRVVAEIERLRSEVYRPDLQTGDHQEKLDELRWRGEAMTAEIALRGAADTFAQRIAARLRAASNDDAAREGAHPRALLAQRIVAALEDHDLSRARAGVSSLLEALSVRPLDLPGGSGV